jgi:hypothetical protein
MMMMMMMIMMMIIIIIIIIIMAFTASDVLNFFVFSICDIYMSVKLFNGDVITIIFKKNPSLYAICFTSTKTQNSLTM